jgi:hypothetical protein
MLPVAKRDPDYLLAKAVSSAVFSSLMNAMHNQDKEDYWRRHADRLESKYTTECGEHYYTTIERHEKRNAPA